MSYNVFVTLNTLYQGKVWLLPIYFDQLMLGDGEVYGFSRKIFTNNEK